MSTLTITWEQLQDMETQAATVGTIDATLTLMEETIRERGTVNITDAFGIITPLTTIAEFNQWRDEFFNEEPQAEEDDEFVDLEPGEPLDDEEFKEIVNRVLDENTDGNNEQIKDL